MGRVNRRPVYKVRYRKPGKNFHTKFSNGKETSSNGKGRIVSKRKVSYEELFRVGEYLPFSIEAILANNPSKE